ncbi:MAG: hypothetical protein GKR88_02810 [Flavobacteriaceae bacterium]|nr:MAG: hypothetical protein GKR88_02810 [Flavobacteriaceae bacterium]
MGIKNFRAGFNIFTGKRVFDEESKIKPEKGIFGRIFSKVPKGTDLGFGANHPYGPVNEVGPKYRLGAAYIGWGDLRIGIDSYRHVGHPIQNIMAHYFFKPQGGFTSTSDEINPYIQYQSQNRYTLW